MENTVKELCEYCGKEFSTLTNRQKHIRNVHRDSEKELCEFCGKEFGKLSYCQRHIKKVHMKNSDEKKKEQIKQFICVFCGKHFTKKWNLQGHIKRVHSSDSARYFECDRCTFKSLYKAHLKRHMVQVHTNDHKVLNKETKPFKCSFCNAQYKHLRSLNFHEKKIHETRKVPRSRKRICPICKFIACGPTAEQNICYHFQTVHSINIKIENLHFDSLEKFYEWKKETEKQTHSFYRKSNSSARMFLYRCHRCGTYKTSGLGRRHLKKMGSCKINAFCPAMVKAKVLKGDDINVQYIAEHVGHKNELKHLHLSKEEREQIAMKLATKTPRNDILKEIKDKQPNSTLQRIHLINRKDIFNIERSFNLNSESVKQLFDPVNVETWIQELKMSEDIALLAYKPQGVISSEFPHIKEQDFLLIFMMQTQLKKLKKYGHNVICIDGTLSLNHGRFQLYTILVQDECREGFPSAFMLTNRGDETILESFFEYVRKVIGPIQPNVFMSNMEEGFYSAWENIMGPSKIKMFSTWHILKAWRTDINSKIKTKEKREKVYKILQSLLFELNEVSFKKMLSRALKSFFDDEETQSFHEYFENQYASREQYIRWAHCYMISAGVYTNMAMDNFNKMLKSCYLQDKQVSNSEKKHCAILNMIKNKLFDLIIKIEKETLSCKARTLKKRHRTSLSLDADSQLQKLSEVEWQVASAEPPGVQTVRRIGYCDSCQLICTHCNSCFHQFMCSCQDSSVRNNMCQHIHLVCRTINCNYVFLEAEETTIRDLNIDTTQKNSYTEEIVFEKIGFDKNIPTLFEEEQEKMLEECRIIQNSLETVEEVQLFRSHLQQFVPLMEAVRSAQTR